MFETLPVKLRPKLDFCVTCKKPGPSLMACGGCGVVAYCSRECQQQDWRAHKQPCRNWLFDAIEAGDRGAEGVGALLDVGYFDPNTVAGAVRYTPLILASVRGHIKVAHVLIEKGADVNVQTNDGTGGQGGGRERAEEQWLDGAHVRL